MWDTTYKAFTQKHTARVLWYSVLPFLCLGVGCAAIALAFNGAYASVLFIGVCFGVCLPLQDTEADGSWPQFVAGATLVATPNTVHTLDHIVSRLRAQKLLPPQCAVLLNRTVVDVPKIYIRGFGSRKHAIVMPHLSRHVWRNGVAEAVIMHEVGHAAYWWSRIFRTDLNWTLDGVCTLAMFFQTGCMFIEFSNGHLILFDQSALGAICCGIVSIVAHLSTKRRLHSIEFLADAYAARTLGVRGAQGLIQYFEDSANSAYGTPETCATESLTHPSMQARIEALKLFIRDAEQ